MNIDLRNLDESSGRLSGRDRVEFADATGEEAILDCGVEVDYTQTGGAYYFKVAATAKMETSCHRCLDPVVCPLRAEFDLVVRRGIDRAAPEADERDDYITIGAKEHEVSLHAFIHENLVVSVPMLILCRDDCKGLCPRCGANLNHGGCDCRAVGDPRWDALRGLQGD